MQEYVPNPLYVLAAEGTGDLRGSLPANRSLRGPTVCRRPWPRGGGNMSSSEGVPTFLVGALRSGTTLLRLMLDHHPAICWFGEFDYAVEFADRAGTPVSVSQYVACLETHRTFRSSAFTIDPTLDVKALLRSFVEQARQRSRKPIVGATVHRHYRRLLEIWPDARFIHIVRDPRDVADSWVRMGWAASPWSGASGWLTAEDEWDRVAVRLTPERRLEVRYEDLIAACTETLSRVCEIVGTTFHPAMLEYARDSTYDLPNPSLLGQWRSRLSERQIRLVETRVGRRLADRGYSPSGLPPLSPSRTARMLDPMRLMVLRNGRGWKRYGPRLLLTEKISRWMHLRERWRCARLAMNEIDRSFVK